MAFYGKECDASKIHIDEQLHFRYLDLVTTLFNYLQERKFGQEALDEAVHLQDFGMVPQAFHALVDDHIFTYEDVRDRPAKRYRKNIPTKLRVLTDEDFHAFGGVIHSLESKHYPFTVPGDYLACGAQGELWVVKKDFVERTYDRVENSRDAEGFELYIKREPVHALRFDRQFRLLDQNDRVHTSAPAGGWFVWTEAAELWICAHELFFYDELKD